jgi:GTP-binding protein
LETNVSLRVADTEQADVFEVAGRGELHLSILVETMRREGYEFQVSRPEVITRRIDGVLCEPMEQLYIDTDEGLVGVVSDLVARAAAGCGTWRRPAPARSGWSTTSRRAV